MTNVLPRVVDLIAADPDTFLIFVPFLGGAHFNKKYRTAAPEIMKNLECIAGPGGIEVYPPTAAERGDFAGHPLYWPPWILIGKCVSKAVRDEISRHPLIAFTPDLAAHVMKVNKLRKSWLLGHWRCNTISPVPPSVMRAAVALHAFMQGPIRTAIVFATQNENGTADEQVYRFVQTLDAACLPSSTEPPLWIIYGRPCTESHTVWENIRDLFRNTTFASGLTEFTPIGSPSRSAGSNIRRLALCYICKLDDHRSDTCPYALLQDWLGPNCVLKEGREGVLALAQGKPPARSRPNEDRRHQRSAVAGDGGYSAPGGHAFEDRPWLEGENATEGTENPTSRDEPTRASSSVGANDVPPSYPLQAPQGPMQWHPVHTDKHAASVDHIENVRPPQNLGRTPSTVEDADSVQPALSGAAQGARANTDVQGAMSQYLNYLAGSAMLPPMPKQTQPPQATDDDIPAFMQVDVDAEDRIWRENRAA
ncbi:hypothetical protein K438DRAFT_2179592 [Mycena galopus ATCC 62051]|nr:hypothetical protein K438DRAFT_2179592 [Mycena galopus ATCC 62051]